MTTITYNAGYGVWQAKVNINPYLAMTSVIRDGYILATKAHSFDPESREYEYKDEVVIIPLHSVFEVKMK